MKKQITILAFFILTSFQITLNAQVINAKDSYGANRLDCSAMGSQQCIGGVSTSQNKTNTQEESPIQIIKNGNYLVYRFWKKNMTTEQQELNFKNKFAYVVDEDIILDESINFALNQGEKAVTLIKQGLYPIIEWEDSYFISYKFEEK